jgi:hypothetical protein
LYLYLNAILGDFTDLPRMILPPLLVFYIIAYILSFVKSCAEKSQIFLLSD